MAKRTDLDQLKEEISQRGEIASMLEAVGERLGTSLGARAVFGQPVKRGDVTVIPVARAAWGFGAGTGAGETESGDPSTGGGGGGGGAAAPMGYIEVTDQGASYNRIDDPLRRAAATALTAIGTAAVLLARSRRKS